MVGRALLRNLESLLQTRSFFE